MTHSALSLRASIALACVAGLAPLAATAGGMKVADGRILVKAVAGLDDEKLAKILEKRGAKAARKLNRLGVRIVEVPAGEELRIANELNRDPTVAFAEPDFLLSPGAIVNDPNYASQWHLPFTGVPTAWAQTMGAGVTVAVCDTGVNPAHPDLAGQVVNGFNTASDNTDTSDINGHGTWVAGVIAAKANNLTGGASVAPATKILAMRITNQTDSTAYASEMAECVTWAADHGARIANISYNGVAGSATVASAASYMMSLGGLVVVAAGNAGSDMGYTNSPYLFTAAATDSSDNRASWSNYGQYIDVAAPGVGIFTTDRGGGYSTVSGTSFSSPHTAATAALVMSANPALSPTDVLSIITNTAKDVGAAGWDAYFGFGRVDTGAAVAMAATVQPSDRTAPSAAVTTPTSGATVSGVVTVDVRATDDFGVMSVDLLVDGILAATDTQEDPALPDVFRFAWDSSKVADGSHRVSARARDAGGNVGSAQEVSVTVKNAVDTTPPVVTSLNPTSSTTVTGTATLSATATDNVGVATLTVSAPGAQCSAAATSVSCPWDTKALASGWYTVTATATDAVGYVNVKANSVYVQATTTTTTTTTTTPEVKVRNPKAVKK